jgi:uncharacterized protein
MLYLQQTKVVEFDIESTESMPIYSVILSLLLSAAVIYYLYKQFTALPPREEALAEAAPEEPGTLKS